MPRRRELTGQRCRQLPENLDRSVLARARWQQAVVLLVAAAQRRPSASDWRRDPLLVWQRVLEGRGPVQCFRDLEQELLPVQEPRLVLLH
jgi:hypothetical protein